jgi:polysaccharide export outer membrane protein
MSSMGASSLRRAGRAWVRGAGRLAFGLFLLLGGCAELPAIGPTIGEVEGDGATLSTDPYVIIDVDKNVAQRLRAWKQSGFAAHFESKAPPPDLRIGIGDIVQINVLEQAPGIVTQPTVLGATTSQATPLGASPMTMQPVQVGNDGSITVPYIGRVVAAGRAPEAVRAEIERKLASKAIFPQVQVSVTNPSGLSANSATVGGEVNRAGIFPLQPSGNRLLDLVAEGGGARFPPYETTVYLTRRGRREEATLQSVLENPKQNLFIYPHDEIYLARTQRTFSVLGASSKVGRYSFETAHVDLAEAVAIGGGFVDASADPAGVYVFRYEPSSLVRALKPEVKSDETTAPVLYRVNLRGGDGYFLSKEFEIFDGDVVLLANSDGAQFQKMLNIVQTITSIGIGVKGIAQQNSVVVSPASTTGGSTVIPTQ